MIDRGTVDAWLRDYVSAWKSNDRAQIAALFAEDVEYRYHPHDEPVRGRDSVAAAWLGEITQEGVSEPDPPGTYDGAYRAVAVEGDVAVAVGTSSYSDVPGGALVRVYDNCFVMRFDEAGRCREFTEWFVERPRK